MLEVDRPMGVANTPTANDRDFQSHSILLLLAVLNFHYTIPLPTLYRSFYNLLHCEAVFAACLQLLPRNVRGDLFDPSMDAPGDGVVERRNAGKEWIWEDSQLLTVSWIECKLLV